MTMKTIFHDILAMFAAAVILSNATGCGPGPPTPAEPAAAREALERALAAWKEGKSAESLKGDDPPIVVSDHVWSKGPPLVKYEIEKGDRRAGANQRFQVVL